MRLTRQRDELLTWSALAASARGYKCVIVMPDDQAKEKSQLLEQYGADVVLVKPASIVNAKHYVNEAKRRANAIEGQCWLGD